MLEALAFAVYGVVFGAGTLMWCFVPWQASSTTKRTTALMGGVLLGVLLATAQVFIHLHFTFMIQFGVPALLAMFLLYCAVRHQPGASAKGSQSQWPVVLLVFMAICGLMVEVLEIGSVWSIIVGIVMSAGVVSLLHLAPEVVADELATKSGSGQKPPRGLPDAPFANRAVALGVGYYAGGKVWLNGPVLSWGFTDVAEFFLAVGIWAVVMTIGWNYLSNKFGKIERRSLIPTRFTWGLVAVSFMLAVVIPGILSNPLFYWQAQSDVLGKTIKLASQADLVNVVRRSNEGRPRLPLTVANNIAHQRLGGVIGRDGVVSSLGKTSVIEHYTLQTLTARFTARGSDGLEHELSFNHEAVYLSPLEPSGARIQLMRGQTDGFVLINANSVDQDNGKLVTHINGKPLAIKYHCNGGYFNANVRRYLYRLGYMYTGLSEGRFVLNPEGRPYCAVAGYRHVTGFRTPVAVQMLLVDVQTGEVQTYEAGKQPTWLDQLHTSWMWETHLEHWGTYRQPGNLGNGWLHQWLDGSGVMQPSHDITRMEVDGRTLYFTTLTDGKSATGYAIGDALTLQTTIYQLPNGGITEDRAKAQVISNDAALASQFRAGGKDAPAVTARISQPIPMVVDDRLIFQMVATNASGAPFRYAFAGIDLVGLTAGGETYPQALIELRSKLEEAAASSGERLANKGRFKMMVAVNGTKETEFWVYLEEFGGTAFAIPAKNAPWLPSVVSGTVLNVVTAGKIRPDTRITTLDMQRTP